MATTLKTLDFVTLDTTVTTVTTAKTDSQTARDASIAAAARSELATDAGLLRDLLGRPGFLVNVGAMGDYVRTSSGAEWSTDVCTLDASNIASEILLQLDAADPNPFKDIKDLSVRIVCQSDTSVNQSVDLQIKFLDSGAAAIQTIIANPIKAAGEALTADGRYWEFNDGSLTIGSQKRYSVSALENIQVPNGATDIEISMINAFTPTGDITIQMWLCPGPFFKSSADQPGITYKSDAATALGTSGSYALMSISELVTVGLGSGTQSTFSLASDIVTVNKTGTYLIGYDGEMQAVSGTNIKCSLRIEVDTGSGYAALAETTRSVHLTSGGQFNACVSTSRIVSITKGDLFKWMGTTDSASTARLNNNGGNLTFQRIG